MRFVLRVIGPVIALLACCSVFSQVPRSVTLTTSSVKGGSATSGVVILDRPAPVGGVRVSLAATSPSILVSGSINLLAGQTSAGFTIATDAVSTVVNAQISARVGSAMCTAQLRLMPPSLVSVAVSPDQMRFGSSSSGTIVIDAHAPRGGLRVQLSSASASLTMPSIVTIPAGQNRANFTVRCGRVSKSIAVAVRASSGSTQASTSVTLIADAPAPIGHKKGKT